MAGDRFSRKGFFGQFFSVMKKGVSSHVEKKLARVLKAPIRPPGALDEVEFLSTCTRCDRCIEACPYDAILKKPMEAGVGANTPYLEPVTRACELCEDFPCIAACGDKALLPVTSPEEVSMGMAVIVEDHCQTWHDKVCTLCYDACPLPEKAITLGVDLHPVVLEGCTGCGACQQRCPVYPVGIEVMSLVNYRARKIDEDYYFGVIEKED